MYSFSLCLTATIRPNTVMVQRIDVAQRLADYKKCIEFYLAELDCPIVFLENSRYNLSDDPDFEVFQKNPRFTLLQLDPHSDTARGKGFQEFFLLDQFVENHLATDILVKITGRYLVRNVSALLHDLKAPLYMDMHRKMKVAITGFFAIHRQAYVDHFLGKYAQANDAQNRFIEHVLYDTICNSGLISQVELFRENPRIEGVSGSYGGSLQRNKYKMMVRQVERKVNRALGIRQFLIEY